MLVYWERTNERHVFRLSVTTMKLVQSSFSRKIKFFHSFCFELTPCIWSLRQQTIPHVYTEQPGYPARPGRMAGQSLDTSKIRTQDPRVHFKLSSALDHSAIPSTTELPSPFYIYHIQIIRGHHKVASGNNYLIHLDDEMSGLLHCAMCSSSGGSNSVSGNFS